VQTFTIGFHEADFQEAPHAAAVARHLGANHSELYVTAADALQVIPGLPEIYDEPFGDSSAIPTHLVARFARRHVTVCLSGDGGDELFGGYTRYQGTEEIWRSMRRIPEAARRLMSAGCGAFAFCSPSTRYGWRARRTGLYLASRTAEQCYAVKTQQWPDARELVLDPGQTPMDDAPLASDDLVARMMYADAMTYLPDDILAKVDRAAMAVSLETRIPLLDHRVVEFAWALPRRMKLREGDSKWLLKRLLAKYVPDALMRRPKMGFGVPVGEWLRGPLRDWAEDLLDEARLRREGFLNPALLRALWQQHLDRTQDAADSLWPVLMFQAWHGAASPACAHRVPSES
jgi:asparagine synthase (glutamine-hydrolysing)